MNSETSMRWQEHIQTRTRTWNTLLIRKTGRRPALQNTGEAKLQEKIEATAEPPWRFVTSIKNSKLWEGTSTNHVVELSTNNANTSTVYNKHNKSSNITSLFRFMSKISKRVNSYKNTNALKYIQCSNWFHRAAVMCAKVQI